MVAQVSQRGGEQEEGGTGGDPFLCQTLIRYFKRAYPL